MPLATDGRGGLTTPSRVYIANVVAVNEGGSLLGNIKMRWRVQIRNDTAITQEVRAYVFDRFGSLIDKEPDLSWKNIKPGATETIEIAASVALDRIKGQYQITMQTQRNEFSDRVLFDGDSGRVVQPISAEKGEQVQKEEASKAGSPLKDVTEPINKLGIIGIAVVGILAILLLLYVGGRR